MKEILSVLTFLYELLITFQACFIKHFSCRYLQKDKELEALRKAKLLEGNCNSMKFNEYSQTEEAMMKVAKKDMSKSSKYLIGKFDQFY